MAFQAGAFQGDAFQIPARARYSGGYSDALSHADKIRRRYKERVESLPEEVKEAIESVVMVDDREDREAAFLGKVRAENKFLRLYLLLLDQYRMELIELERIERDRREDDDLALILLMSY